MENAYGIGITNRYALFIDEDEAGDPIDIIKQAEVADKKVKKVEAKPAPKAAPKKEPVKKEDSSDKENQRNNQRFEGKRVLDARRAQEGPREERNNRINQEGGPPRREYDGEGRDRGRGGRGGRGMGRGRGEGAPRGRDQGGRGGKREFERKSGDSRTGVKAEEKRGGGGKGNWGTMEDELKESEDAPVNTSVEENGAPKEEEEKKEEVGEEGQMEKEEEEPKQLTLDEWKALQGKKDQPKFNLRKPGEGSDIDPKWKKAAAYKKEKVNEDDEEEEDENYVYPQRANRQKHLLDIDFHFADQHVMGGGGRGRGRGRGGRGEGRGGRGEGRGGFGEGRGGFGEGRGGRGEGRGGFGEGRGGRGGPREGDAPPRRGGRGRGDGQQFSLDDQKAFPALG